MLRWKNTYRYHNGYIENQFEQKKFSFLVILVHKTNYYQRSDILSDLRKMFWIDFLHFVLISRSVQFQLSLKKFWNILGLISFLFLILERENYSEICKTSIIQFHKKLIEIHYKIVFHNTPLRMFILFYFRSMNIRCKIWYHISW